MAAREASLVVRRLRVGDAQAALAVIQAPAVLRRFPNFPSRPDLSLVEALLAAPAGSPDVRVDHWGAFDGGELVCLVTFAAPSVGNLSLAYAVAPGRWNEGVATEAVARVLRRVAAETGGPVALEAATYADNRASGRVLEKLGFWRWSNRRERGCEVALFRRVLEAPAADLGVVLAREARRSSALALAAA